MTTTTSGTGRPSGGGARVQFRVDAGTRTWLESRRERMLLAWDGGDEATSADLQARRELLMWQQVLGLSLLELPEWTLPEARILAEAAGGEQMSTALQALGPDGLEPVMWREVLDSLAGGALPDDGTDYAGLLARLKKLTLAQDTALRDALSRWWAQEDRDDSPEAFRAFGLQIAGGADE